MAKKTCEKCGRTMQELNFYTYKNGEKFELCKACLTMHIDNFDESTYLWILQKADVPYVPDQWNRIRDKAYAKAPNKMNGMSVIGKYLSLMKLKQWKKYSWADNEKIQEQRERDAAVKNQQNQAEAENAKQRFLKGEITQAQYRTITDSLFQKQNEGAVAGVISQYPGPNDMNPIGQDNMFNENNFIDQSQLPSFDDQLTIEDKRYLAMKWGRNYKVSEWVQLEKKYDEMMESFDIQDADSKNTLIFICKTYLKMNQAIDCGDVEGYQKLSRVYDALRKSAKFTAAQNKENKTDFIDSVGQLVAYCEKVGHKIPKYEITTPYDIVDKVIQDQKQYVKTLIYEDTALARQIEDYLKELRAAAAKKKDKDQAEKQGYDVPQLTEQDILDFKQFIKKEKETNEQEEKE